MADYEVVHFLGRGQVAALYEVRSADGRTLLAQVFNLRPSVTAEGSQAPDAEAAIPWVALDPVHRLTETPGEADASDPNAFVREWFRKVSSDVRAWQAPAMPEIVAGGTIEDRGVLVLDSAGESLMARVDRAGPLGEAEALDAVRRVSEALAPLHGGRPPLAFGEVRPSNVRLDETGAARFITYGETRFIEPPRRGVVNRAPSVFTSPERRANRDESLGSDVYCLGALLYFLMSGAIPEADGASTPPLRAVHPDAGEIAERVVRRCMHREPIQRYQSLADLRQALSGNEPPPPDTRPPVMVVDTEDFYFEPVLPGVPLQQQLTVRNQGGGRMAVTVVPESDYVKVNPSEFEANEERVTFWITTDLLMPNNRHNTTIRLCCGQDVKFVRLSFGLLPKPKLSTTERSGWLARLLVPVVAALLGAMWYVQAHGLPDLWHLFKGHQ